MAQIKRVQIRATSNAASLAARQQLRLLRGGDVPSRRRAHRASGLS
jgi:hypothetical protein